MLVAEFRGVVFKEHVAGAPGQFATVFLPSYRAGENGELADYALTDVARAFGCRSAGEYMSALWLYGRGVLDRLNGAPPRGDAPGGLSDE